MSNPRAYSGNKPFVFLSYSHADASTAYPFILELQKHVNVWFDEGITPGIDYKKNIINHINECSVFLFFVTDNSLNSEFCRKEIEFATKKNKNFINIIVNEITLPDWFEFDYGYIQSFMLYKYGLTIGVSELVRKSKAWFNPCLISNEVESEKSIFEASRLILEQKEESIVQSKPNIETKPKPRIKVEQMSSDVLDDYEINSRDIIANRKAAEEYQEVINNVFRDFKVKARVENYDIGPTVTRFNVKYGHDTSVKTVSNLISEIEMRLPGKKVRFENIVQGSSMSGIYVSNVSSIPVPFKEVYEALPDNHKNPLAIAFGKNVKGDIVYANYDEFPHLLVGGGTRSGKSLFLHSIILSLIMRNSPEDISLVLIDTSKAEMFRYDGLPHLLRPVVDNAKEADFVLEKLVTEMDDRYNLFFEKGCSNIQEYNEKSSNRLPRIFVFFDEYADVYTKCEDIYKSVMKLAQKARASGIHLCIATKHTNSNILTGALKANLPATVALKVDKGVDSFCIINEGGAEDLIGKGDMLVKTPLISRVGLERIQGPSLHYSEIKSVVYSLKQQYGSLYSGKFIDISVDDEVLPFPADGDEEQQYQAIKSWVLKEEYVSMTSLQKQFGIGFNRAGRFFMRLQAEDIVAKESDGHKGCRVLVHQ